jgi:hypothetical protein
MSLPIATDLTALNGANGYQMFLQDLENTGSTVASAGDVNGDGFDDLIFSAGFYSHSSFVVFSHGGAVPADVQSSWLDGTNGFRMEGQQVYGGGGGSVASAGDVNGDGFDDIIVGDIVRVGSSPGGAFVVFGKAAGFEASIDLTKLRPEDGFHITGARPAGWSVASAGDVNGDGLDDMLVGEPSSGRDWSGVTSVVFGSRDPFPSELSAATLNGQNGFRIFGDPGNSMGVSVAGAGDVNGDGLADIVVGAGVNDQDSHAAYVVFGRSDGFAPELRPGAGSSADGFVISAEGPGGYYVVAGAGDVNGDGVDDLIIGAPNASPNGQQSGSAYVVFGRTDGFPNGVSLAALDGQSGFRIDGDFAWARAGGSVAGAGDLNNDGFDDIVLSAAGAFNWGPSAPTSGPGATYVLYGHAGAFAPEINVASIGGDLGFRIADEPGPNRYVTTVASAGDVNGDGAPDLAIGGTAGGYVLFGDPAMSSAAPASPAGDWLI